MRKSKIIVTSLAVIFVILLMFGTTVFSAQNGMLNEEEQQVSNNDSDGDTLDDAMEYLYYGTDPLNPDTDGDGLTDGEEITQGTDPQDPNNPCTTCIPTAYVEEEQTVSNGDSDGDMLKDAMECIYYGTDPFNPDTDGDGLTDGEEITQGTNPQDPNDP